MRTSAHHRFFAILKINMKQQTSLMNSKTLISSRFSSPSPSLPASWYHDAQIYQRERERIFARHWLVAAREAQLKNIGDYVTTSIAGWPVIVIRNEHGLQAFHNVCRHRAAPLLTEPAGQCQQLRCPYHGWSYQLDGQLQYAPGFELGRGAIEPGTMDLLALRLACWNGIVFVCADQNAVDLSDWLGDIVTIAKDFPAPGEMEFHREIVNEGDVNWKTYSDNSAEGYHLGSVHPSLSHALLRERTEIKAYENGQFVGFNVVYKASPEQRESRGFWIYKFPGLLLHFSESGFNLERVIPLSAQRTRLMRWFWFQDSLNEEHKNAAVAFSNQVMDEDLNICQQVQQNLQAGVYQTGCLSPEREPGTIYFQQLVLAALSSSDNN